MSNINILPPIFFLLLFTFSHCNSKFNEMTSSSLKEFIDDSEKCLNVENGDECIGTSLSKKGEVASQCCIVQASGEEDSYCQNLSNNEEIQNYLLYFLSSSGDFKYSCSSEDSNMITFKKDQTPSKEYEKINYEIVSALDADTKESCFSKADSFKSANGCCFISNNCVCFSNGISKNEMDILLMLMEKDANSIKDEIIYCKDKSGEKSGKYSQLFENSEDNSDGDDDDITNKNGTEKNATDKNNTKTGSGGAISFNGILGLLWMIIDFIL